MKGRDQGTGLDGEMTSDIKAVSRRDRKLQAGFPVAVLAGSGQSFYHQSPVGKPPEKSMIVVQNLRLISDS